MSGNRYKVILYLLILTPIIDTINGIFITLSNNGVSLIGKTYRIVVFLGLLYVLWKSFEKNKRINTIKKYFWIFIIVLIYFSFYLFLNKSIESILYDLIEISKIILPFYIFVVLKVLIENNKIDKFIIEKIFNSLQIIFPLTLIIPYFLNIGLVTYDNSYGFKGFYVSNNDLSIVLLVMCIFSMSSLFKFRNKLKAIIFILNSISLLLIGSKTSFIGLGIVIISFLINELIKNRENILNKKNIKNSIIYCILITISILLFRRIIFDIIDKMVDRFMHFYSIKGSIIKTMLSDRDIYFQEAIIKFFDGNFIVIKILLGVGFYYRKQWGKAQVIEMDFADIFLSLGIIVFILIIIFLINLFIKKKDKDVGDNFKYTISFIIILSFSFTAGHVFFSALSGTILGLIFVGMYFDMNKTRVSDDKKIMILNLGSQYGGVEKQIESYIEYSDNTKNYVIVTRARTIFSEKIYQLTNNKKNILVVNVEFNKKNIFSALKKLKKIIREHDLNIIHAHGITSTLIALIIKENFIKVITTVHGYSDMDRIDRSKYEKLIFKYIEKITVSKSDICIAVSKDIKNYLINRGIKKEKIYVVYNGVKYDRYDKIIFPKNNGKIIIGAVGRLESVKNYETLIKSIRKCKDNNLNNIHCIIAGEGTLYEKLNEQIKSYDLSDICKLIGLNNNVENLLREIDIFIQPSLIESFGISIVEAMIQGCVIISSNVGGIPEIIDDNKNGFLIKNPKDENEIFEKIQYIIKKQKEMDGLLNKARDKGLKEFCVKKMVINLDEIYSKL